MQRLLLLGTCAALRPTPAPRRTVRCHSTAEQTTKFAGEHGPADSEAWLARQGLVQPGASPEIHEIARKARRKKKGTKALALRPKKARWGDAPGWTKPCRASHASESAGPWSPAKFVVSSVVE